ncbi:MAG: peptide-binding protein [Solidesulfovibrio sp.]
MRLRLSHLLPVLLATSVLLGAGCASKPKPVTQVDPKSVFKVQAALLNLLSCPSITCEVLEDLHSGQEVAILMPNVQGWSQVRVLSSGHEGFVEAKFLGR